MIEVTISIPVTARFDGCWCSDCQHMCYQTDMLGYTALRCAISVDEGCFSTRRIGVAIGKLLLDAPKKNGAVVFNGGRNTTMLINMDALIDANIRTRWCCETFGMGVTEPTEHEIWTNIDGTTVDLTQNAMDNEALGRCTFDE